MADTTVSTLVFKMTMDSRKFTDGIVASKRELRDAKRVMESVKTPAEKIREEIDKLGTLYKKGAIDMETYRRAMLKLKAAMNETGTAAAANRSSVGQSNQNLMVVAGRFLSMAALMQTAKRTIGLSAAAETSRVGYENILGDVRKAHELMADISEFSTKTPFTPSELRDAGRSLLAFNFAAEEVVPTLQRLGDMSALSGRPLQEFVNIVGKVRDRNRVTLETMNEFGLRASSMWEPLQKSMGVTREELEKMISTGKVGFKELEGAMKAMTSEGGIAFNQTIKQSETLAGKFSTLTGNVDLFMESVGTENIEGLTKFTERLNDLVEVSGKLKDLAPGSSGLFRTAGTVGMGDLFDQAGDAISKLNATLGGKDGSGVDAMTGATKKVNAELAKTEKKVDAIEQTFKSIKSQFTGFKTLGSQDAFRAVVEFRYGDQNKMMERRKLRVAEESLEELRDISDKVGGSNSFGVVSAF